MSGKKVRKEKELSIRYEYTTPMQNEKIEKDLKSYYTKVKLRLAFAVLLSVMLFLLENITAVKALFPTRFGSGAQYQTEYACRSGRSAPQSNG